MHPNKKASAIATEAKNTNFQPDDLQNRQKYITFNGGGAQADSAADCAARGAAEIPAFQFSVLKSTKNLLATKTIFADGTQVPYGHSKFFYFQYCEIPTLERFAGALIRQPVEPSTFT